MPEKGERNPVEIALHALFFIATLAGAVATNASFTESRLGSEQNDNPPSLDVIINSYHFLWFIAIVANFLFLLEAILGHSIVFARALIWGLGFFVFPTVVVWMDTWRNLRKIIPNHCIDDSACVSAFVGATSSDMGNSLVAIRQHIVGLLGGSVLAVTSAWCGFSVDLCYLFSKGMKMPKVGQMLGLVAGFMFIIGPGIVIFHSWALYVDGDLGNGLTAFLYTFDSVIGDPFTSIFIITIQATLCLVASAIALTTKEIDLLYVGMAGFVASFTFVRTIFISVSIGTKTQRALLDYPANLYIAFPFVGAGLVWLQIANVLAYNERVAAQKEGGNNHAQL